MMRVDGIWFEVVSDVLYLDGRTLHRGDVLSQPELGNRAEQMVKLGMVRVFAAKRRVA